MNRSLLWTTFGGLAVCAASLLSPARAEDPKAKPADEDLWKNDKFGVKVWKPKGVATWKFVGENAWAKWFSGGTDNVVFVLNKWQKDNVAGELEKGQPLVRMYSFRYDSHAKYTIGKWQGTGDSTKSFAQALFEELLENDFKDPKNKSDTDDLRLPCGKACEFSCYAIHKKSGAAMYIRVILCKDGGNLFEFVIQCAPGEEKKQDTAAEIRGILNSIAFFKVDKK